MQLTNALPPAQGQPMDTTQPPHADLSVHLAIVHVNPKTGQPVALIKDYGGPTSPAEFEHRMGTALMAQYDWDVFLQGLLDFLIEQGIASAAGLSMNGYTAGSLAMLFTESYSEIVTMAGTSVPPMMLESAKNLAKFVAHQFPGRKIQITTDELKARFQPTMEAFSRQAMRDPHRAEWIERLMPKPKTLPGVND